MFKILAIFKYSHVGDKPQTNKNFILILLIFQTIGVGRDDGVAEKREGNGEERGVGNGEEKGRERREDGGNVQRRRRKHAG